MILIEKILIYYIADSGSYSVVWYNLQYPVNMKVTSIVELNKTKKLEIQFKIQNLQKLDSFFVTRQNDISNKNTSILEILNIDMLANLVGSA